MTITILQLNNAMLRTLEDHGWGHDENLEHVLETFVWELEREGVDVTTLRQIIDLSCLIKDWKAPC